MTWKKNWDLFNRSWDGDVFLFGGHYTTSEMRKLMEEDVYDTPDDYEVKEHCWVRFCIVNYEGEKSSGWLVQYEKPKSMRGCIEATELKSVEHFSKLD